LSIAAVSVRTNREVITLGVGEFYSHNYESSGMNYFFTASPPQADLSALGIVTKKQASTHILIRPMDIADS
jgi:hypothetical protein